RAADQLRRSPPGARGVDAHPTWRRRFTAAGCGRRASASPDTHLLAGSHPRVRPFSPPRSTSRRAAGVEQISAACLISELVSQGFRVECPVWSHACCILETDGEMVAAGAAL